MKLPLLQPLLDWLDSRTGVRRLAHEALNEKVPGGARWRYVWGSTLTFVFMVQVITGLLLWSGYSASAQTAWESVFHIEHVMWGGWLLRGIHHFAAHAMVVLLVLHLMQVVIDGAYTAPREVNFWFGLVLLGLSLGLALTGYLLPWDQKGFWATKVATDIAGITPVVGPQVQRVIVGGADYGHATLTRFFALHAGVLPALVVAAVVGHIYLFRKHGLTPAKPIRKPDGMFWPDQMLMDAVACLAVMATVLVLTFWLRAPLSAPADPSEPFPARPEWYFLFLFQFLKLFPGGTEVWGAIVIPGLVMAVVFAMPFLGRWRLGHGFNLVLLAGVLLGAGVLTWQAWAQDRRDPAHQLAMRRAELDAARAVQLALRPEGIPPAGALELLRADPLTQGPRLFSQHCASCHRFDGHDGLGLPPSDPPSAPDLKGIGSREWLAGLLDPVRVDSPHYFGGTRFNEGKMVRFVKRDVPKFDDAERRQLAQVIAAVSAEAALPAQREADARDAADIAAGREAFHNDMMRCGECHAFHSPTDDATAPLLTGWASRDWLLRFIRDPEHADFYGRRNDRMPRFGAQALLTEAQIGLLADWLRGDWHGPAGGTAER